MKLVRLEMENFRRARRLRWEVPDGVTAILGPNGAGKSTLLEAIAFALYGTDALRTGKELVRSEGASATDAVRVSLEMEWGGQAIHLVREMRGKNLQPQASLTVDGAVLVPPGAGSSEAATRETTRRLGMGLDAFLSTVVARQGELARLATAKPLERKQLLLRLLGIERLDEAIERARGQRRDAEAGLAEVRRRANPDAEAVVAAAASAAESAARARDSAREQATAAAQAATRALQALQEAQLAATRQQAARHRLELASATLATLEAKEAELAASLEKAQKARTEQARLEPLAALVPVRQAAVEEAHRLASAAALRAEGLRSIAQMESRRSLLAASLAQPIPEDPGTAPDLANAVLLRDQSAAAMAVLAARTTEAEQHVVHLRGLGADGPCPTCARPLAGHLPSLLLAQEQRAAALAEEETASRRRLAAAELELARLRAAESAHRQRAQLRSQALFLREREATEAAQLAIDIESARSRLPAEVGALDPRPLLVALREAEAAASARTRLAALAESVTAQEAAVARTQAELKGARAACEAAKSDVAGQGPDPTPLAQEAWARAQAIDRRFSQELAAAEVANARAEAAIAAARASLAAELGRRERERTLEREAQHWGALAGRSGGGLLDRFRDHLAARIGPALQAEASRLLARFTGGRYTELILDSDFGLYLSDGGVPYTLERFSGGEQDAAHLALRLAASRLVAERAGADVRLLALDEVFGSLDRERRDLVVATLESLGGLYSQVLVISHLEGLREALGQGVEVVERDGAAHLVSHNG
ncbi:MAG: SMC family ATPase [Candidatus Thermoplasmatota archaeon]